MNANTGPSTPNKALPQFIGFLLIVTLLSGCIKGQVSSVSSAPQPAFSATLAATPTAFSTLPPISTPTETATPLPLPSEEELNVRFTAEVKPLVDQLVSAKEDTSATLDADTPIVYVPMNERLYYIQVILQINHSPVSTNEKTAYILYDYTRGSDLTTGHPWMSTSSPETQEITSNLRLILAENGTFKLIERSKATGGEGSTSYPNIVENAFKPLDKLSGSAQSIQTDLEDIIGYACGIDMMSTLDYQRKVALLTFALSSDNWAARKQAAEALGALDPLPVSAAPALIPLLANKTEDLYSVSQTLSDMATDPQVFNLLLASLKDPNTQIRQYSAMALQSVDPKPASLLEPFITLLHDEDASVRQVAESWLSYYGDPTVIPPMIIELSDKSPEIRLAAAEVLQQYGAQAASAVPALTKLLQDPEADVRAAAARTLGAVGNSSDSVLPDLNKVVSGESDPDAFQSEVAAIAALSSKADTLQLLSQELKQDNSNLREITCNILSDYQGVSGVTEILISAMNDPEYYVRRNAYSALGNLGSEAASALPKLTQIAQTTTNYREYEDVLTAIGSINSKADTLPLLKQALASNEVGIRRTACNVLSTYQGVPGAEEALTTAIHDTDETVRQCAASALTTFSSISNQPEDNLDELIQAAENETDPNLFNNEIQSIISMKDKAAALPVLKQGLAGDNVKIKVQACKILVQYSGISGAVEILIPAVNDKDASVREAAATSLQAFGNEASSALANLQTAASKETDRLAFEAQMGAVAAVASPAEAYPLIQAKLKSGQSQMRVAATNSLKYCKDIPEAIDLLISLMHDADEMVRDSAVGTIYDFGSEGKKAIPELIKALGNPQDYYVYIGAAQALGAIGPDASPAVPALVHMVQTAGDLEKQYPLDALAKIGPTGREAVPALMQFLNNIPQSNWTDELRKDCLKALASITQEDFGTNIQKWNSWWTLNKGNW